MWLFPFLGIRQTRQANMNRNNDPESQMAADNCVAIERGMRQSFERWYDTRILRARTWLHIAVVFMTFAALVWLGYEFYRLLWQPDQIGGWRVHPGAIDVKLRHRDVQRWFAGTPIHAAYPPASFAVLWPLLGWLDEKAVTLMWAGTTLAMLGWLVYLTVRESGADSPLEKAFAALIPLSMYPTGATIGNGQLILHLLPMLVAGLLLVYRGGQGWCKDLLASAMILVSLVKPSISVPFFWILLFVYGRLRPALLVSLGYIILTFFAASFQDSGLLVLFHDWLTHGSKLAVTAGKGYASVHIGLAALGLEHFILLASLLILVALGIWTYCFRNVDLWLLMGVAAIVTRFWTYHRWYDDLLILLPMISLFRIAKKGSSVDVTKVLASVLLGITILAMLAPGGLYLFPRPWNMCYVTGQIVVWLSVLVFLLNCAWREKRQYGSAKVNHSQ